MPLRDVTPSERGALKRLLDAEGLPTADLDAPGRTFYRAGNADAYIGVENYGADALLRSLVVAPEARGRGLARSMIRDLIDICRALDVARVWLLTLTAADFFAKAGFERVDRAAAPPLIAATTEFADLCPATAVCMVKRSE